MKHVTSYFVRLGERLTRSDVSQVSTLFFAVLVVGLMSSWPGDSNSPNNSWYAVVQLRLFLLSFLALGYGAAVSSQARPQQRLALGIVLTLTLLSMPFEAAGFAASYPRSSLTGSLLVSMLDSLALFGLGLLCGYALEQIRLSFLLPLVVPALIAGFVALDIFWGWRLLPPFTFELTTPATWPHTHLAMMGMMGILSIYLLRPYKAEANL